MIPCTFALQRPASSSKTIDFSFLLVTPFVSACFVAPPLHSQFELSGLLKSHWYTLANIDPIKAHDSIERSDWSSKVDFPFINFRAQQPQELSLSRSQNETGWKLTQDPSVIRLGFLSPAMLSVEEWMGIIFTVDIINPGILDDIFRVMIVRFCKFLSFKEFRKLF